jgi:hypothetical protein
MPDRTYRSVQVAEPGAPLTGVDLPIHEPGPGQARVTVQASVTPIHNSSPAPSRA